MPTNWSSVCAKISRLSWCMMTRNHITSFNIFYSSHDPHLAQQVTGELTNLFISENLELRQQKSEDTTKFLEQQLETARQNFGGAGRKGPGIQRSASRRVAVPIDKQCPNPVRTPVPTAERRGWSQRRPAAERLLAVDAGTVPCSAENAQEWGRHTGRNTRFGPTTREAQSATRRSPLALHRSSSRRS